MMDLITRAKNAAHFNPSSRAVIHELIERVRFLELPSIAPENKPETTGGKNIVKEMVETTKPKPKPKVKTKAKK